MTQTTKTYTMDMTTGPLLPKMLRFMLPLIFTGFLQLAFNMADTVVIGQFAGSSALAAVGSTNSLIALLTNLFIGLSIGTSIGAAQYFGSGEREKVNRMVHTSMLLSVILGVGVMLIGFFFSFPMLQWMDTPSDIIDQANLYMVIFFIGAPALLIYNFGAAVLRAVGDTKRPLYMLLAAGIVNVVLNLLFVIVFHWDVAGVAIATVVSQYMSAIMIIICLMRSDECYRLNLRQLRLHKDMTGFILRIGLPSGLQSAVFNISNVLIQSGLNSFGSIVVAGCSASGIIENIVYISMGAVTTSVMSFIGQNFGARNMKNVSHCARMSVGLVTVIGLSLGLVVLVFCEPLLHLFTPDPAVISVGVEKMRILVMTYWLCGIMDVLSGCVRGMGCSLSSMLVTVIGVCGIRIVWLFTVFKLSPSLLTLYISYPLSWGVTLLVQAVNYLITRRRFVKKFAAQQENLSDAPAQELPA